MTFGSVFGRTFSPTFQPKSLASAVATTVDVIATNDGVFVGGLGVPNRSYGKLAELRFGASQRRSIVRFILSSLPAAATCISATMKLKNLIDVPGDCVLQAWAISVANSDWWEGNTSGSDVVGAACWSYKAYDPSTPTAWAGSAGMSTAGVDYENSLMASVSLTTASKAGDTIELPFTSAGLTMLTSWFGDATNPGFLLRLETESVYHKVHSINTASGNSYKPTLTITYS